MSEIHALLLDDGTALVTYYISDKNGIRGIEATLLG